MSSTQAFSKLALKPVNRTLLALCCAAVTLPAFAVPDFNDFSSADGATYVEGVNTGTITAVADNSVVSFVANGAGAEGFNVGAGESINFNGTNGWNLLVRDTSGSQSNINGLLSGGLNVFLVNTAGILFGAGAEVDLGGLVASTLDVDDADFSTSFMPGGDEQYVFSNAGGKASIIVNGLQSLNSGADISLLAGEIQVNGAMTVPGGTANLVVAEQVTVSFDSAQMIQFDVTQEVAVPVAGINVAAGGAVVAANVNMLAGVSDVVGLALNVDGVVTATGLNATEGGVIRLEAPGNFVRLRGDLDVEGGGNANGSIEVIAEDLQLAGTTVTGGASGSLSMQIGADALDGTGIFGIDGLVSFDIGNISLFGQSAGDTALGLSNFFFDGADSGTAQYQGLTTNTINIADLDTLRSPGNITDVIEITSTGSFSGELYGGGGDDLFIIAGTANILSGGNNNDTFQMNGGSVVSLDGGLDMDSIVDARNPTTTGPSVPGPGDDGFSDDITGWTFIESVTPYVPPVTPVTPASTPPTFLVPRPPIVNINNLANSALGLIGDGSSLRMPCGHTSRDFLPTSDEALAAAEVPCDDDAQKFAAMMERIVYFDTDIHELTLESQQRLQEIASFVRGMDSLNSIVIAGHTDDVASDAYNLALSERRALSVARFMAEQGVEQDALKLHFYGELLPAVPNDSVANRALNRRVEVTLER